MPRPAWLSALASSPVLQRCWVEHIMEARAKSRPYGHENGFSNINDQAFLSRPHNGAVLKYSNASANGTTNANKVIASHMGP